MPRKKKTEAAVIEAPNEVGKTIADVVVPTTGEVIVSYSKENAGEKWVDVALAMAQKKNLEVRFR